MTSLREMKQSNLQKERGRNKSHSMREGGKGEQMDFIISLHHPSGPLLLRTTLMSLGAAKPPGWEGDLVGLSWIPCPGPAADSGMGEPAKERGEVSWGVWRSLLTKQFLLRKQYFVLRQRNCFGKKHTVLFQCPMVSLNFSNIFGLACFVVVVSLYGMKTQIAWSLFFFLSG